MFLLPRQNGLYERSFYQDWDILDFMKSLFLPRQTWLYEKSFLPDKHVCINTFYKDNLVCMNSLLPTWRQILLYETFYQDILRFMKKNPLHRTSIPLHLKHLILSQRTLRSKNHIFRDLQTTERCNIKTFLKIILRKGPFSNMKISPFFFHVILMLLIDIAAVYRQGGGEDQGRG